MLRYHDLPTPILILQNIGTNMCAVPLEELCEADLLARPTEAAPSQEDASSDAGDTKDLTSSSA